MVEVVGRQRGAPDAIASDIGGRLTEVVDEVDHLALMNFLKSDWVVFSPTRGPDCGSFSGSTVSGSTVSIKVCGRLPYTCSRPRGSTTSSGPHETIAWARSPLPC